MNQPLQEQLFLPSSQTEEGARTTRASSTLLTEPMEVEIRQTEGAALPSVATTAQASTPDTATTFTPDSTEPRRSDRQNKGQYSSTRYINEVFLASVQEMDNYDNYHAALLYQAELETDMTTFESEITDPRVYNAKFCRKQIDPDTPTFHEAMSGLEADKYIEAMKEEIMNLKRMNTWIMVDREPRMKVLKGTWAFKLK